MKDMDSLNVPVPSKKNLVVRPLKQVSLEQRTKVLEETEYNMFSFPADLLVVDFLSDSGTTAMTDIQWASLFHGDESYARNKGYFVLLDAIRDIFERGDKMHKKIDLLLTGEHNAAKLIKELYCKVYQGGFVNGGKFQLERPNSFIVPQGRCAEHLLFSTLRDVLNKKNPNKDYYIPNNGHFDTTEANIRANQFHPVNFFEANLFHDFPVEEIEKANPFKGNMNVKELRDFIEEMGADSIPLIYITITNNTAAGQPVSLSNIKKVAEIANSFQVPLFFDACRFAENAFFIKKYEREYSNDSISEIVKKMFSYADGFTISFKKDGLANIGGGLFFKDKGVFHEKYSVDDDIGILLKEKQILTFGNDSYGGLSGRDIMALATGLYEIIKFSYLKERIGLVKEFAIKLRKKNIPVLLPPGGHAVYLNMDEFFEDSDIKIQDFGGVGFTIELLKRFGIRACELGPFAFEWDKKSKEERKNVLNLVRFAVPRNVYNSSHIDYAVAAIEELFNNRDQIPRVKINRGKNLRLRHFQSGLVPIYK